MGPASVHIRRRWSAEHPEKAGQVAGTYGVDAEAIYGYEDFERIKDNGRIDVVYIVLPNSMHAEYTIRAPQSGKHVLCEKPMAASLAECEAMIDASAKREDPRRRLSSAL